LELRRKEMNLILYVKINFVGNNKRLPSFALASRDQQFSKYPPSFSLYLSSLSVIVLSYLSTKLRTTRASSF
jgi:hypothetical protein